MNDMKHEQQKPLQNLRILDLSSALAGPFCTLHLGAFGAEIIEVDPQLALILMLLNPMICLLMY
jgi:crotonobetainyl-CoA:carnitine CoA-transferase CaiB-like acyl-CoA transferase